MNVEDEFFSAIENRDTAIMARDKKIKEQSTKISEQNEMLKRMAASMLAKGFDIEEIAIATGKSVDIIRRILDN